MAGVTKTDVCVLGSGPVAAALAAGAAQLGARVVMAEAPGIPRRPVILKALAEAARVAAVVRSADGFGIRAGAVAVHWPIIRRHVEEAVLASAAEENRERLTAVGIAVADGPARFVDPAHVTAGGRTIRARRFFIVPALAHNSAEEALLALPSLPERVIVEGSGAHAVALAQSLARLGCGVRLDGPPSLLAGFDGELAALALRRLAVEGVETGAGGGGGGMRLSAVDPSPLLDGLGLDRAGIARDSGGIVADRRGRTANRRVWVVPAGAVHPSAAAGAVLAAALLRAPTAAAVDLRVAFTDPELVQVGEDEEAVRARGASFRLLRWPVGGLEQASAERRAEGLVKAVVDRRGRVLGAGILAPRAAEMAVPWAMAVRRRLPVSAVAAAAPPSPSFADAGRLAAASAVMPLLLSGRLRRWVRLMLALG